MTATPQPWRLLSTNEHDSVIVGEEDGSDVEIGRVYGRANALFLQRLLDRVPKRALEPGFQGQRGEVIAEAEEAGHLLRVVRYAFPCGATALYVEASETHAGHHGAALLPLSDVVHLAQNVSEQERWAITTRDGFVAYDAWKDWER